MDGNKRVILHLVFDGILFDRVYPRFEAMDMYKNIYLFGSLRQDVEIQYIKNVDNIIRVYSLEEWGKIVNDPIVDIIYLHGLWYDYLKAIDYIRDGVVVMWWCYGMELYENCFNRTPLLPLCIYKPKTFKYIQRNSKGLSVKIHNYLNNYHPLLLDNVKKMFRIERSDRQDILKCFLERINYIYTPLEIEYKELKKNYHFFKAQPYRLYSVQILEPPVLHKKTGGIMFEHSANLSNNHLDVISDLNKKKLDLRGRDIFIPLTYGPKEMVEIVKRKAVFNGAHVHCLLESIPYKEYNEMIAGCTHAIYGMIRQSGLGNIYICFRKGIKVFFYKDSLLYKHFKENGFFVYTIEDDLTDDSIKEPLTVEQAKNNYDKYSLIYDSKIGTYQDQLDNILKH